MQRYLITGGAGFIGSHLAEALIHRGHTVYVLDDESTGTRDNLAAIIASPNLKFVPGTIMDDAVLSRLVGTCHHVIHLAAAVGVKYILDHPLASIMTNVVGTEHVLRYCAEFEKPLFLASTSEVYGLQTKAPLREDDYCVLGATSVSRWSYACSKAGLWMLTRVLAQELSPYNISVNELIPGPVVTRMTQTEQVQSVFGIEGEWAKTPEEVVPLALFLATKPDIGPTAQSFSLIRRDN